MCPATDPALLCGLDEQQQKGKGFKFAPGHGPAVPQACPETGSGFIMGGPFWAGPIHDPAWIQGLLTAIDVRSPLTAAAQQALIKT